MPIHLQKRNLKGDRNEDGDLTIRLTDEDYPFGGHERVVKETGPRYMDEYDPDPTLDADIKDLADRIKAWRDSEDSKNRQTSIKEREEQMKLLDEEIAESKAQTSASAAEMLKKIDPKPGWHKNEGANWWNVDSESPYWQTEEGYQEAIKLWGKKPGWIKRGSGDKPHASTSSGR